MAEEEFERGLHRDIPRGLKGREDNLPRTRWAEPEELLPKDWDYSSASGGLFLGYRKGRMLGWSDDRHALTVAGTRAGKGASLIVPNLLLYPGSVLAIDPKGELARITGRRRKELGNKLVVLDPFGENGRWKSGNYNPLAELDPKGKEVIDEAGAIAQALVVYSGQGDPHWTSAARALLRALILLTLTLDENERNLVTVRELLMLTHKTVEDTATAQKLKKSTALFGMMAALEDKFERVVCGQGEAFRDMHEKERESVLSEARTQTQFLDSPPLREVLTKSDFSLKDLKREKLSVFLCLPARHMDTHDRWLRVIINLAVGALEPRRSDPKDKNKPPVLLLLEEFPVLKHMEKLEAAAGQLAGSGVKLWVIVQNLGQLKRHYEKGWETFIANAGVITAFGNADIETLEYVSKKLGKAAMRVERGSGASSSALLGGARLTQEDLKEWPLLDTDESEQQLARERLRVLVLAAGRPPVLLRRTQYWGDPRFKGMFDE